MQFFFTNVRCETLRLLSKQLRYYNMQSININQFIYLWHDKATETRIRKVGVRKF